MEKMSFREWLEHTFYVGFDPTDLSDDEYYALEDEYCKYLDAFPSVV